MKRLLALTGNWLELIAGRLLESLGAVVCTAVDGEEGAAAAIEMPRLDGVAATRRIRGAGGAAAAVPIMGLTASVLSDQREEYLAAGMDSVVGKPISPSVLLREILAISAPSSAPSAAAVS